jgi:hypothetical protein
MALLHEVKNLSRNAFAVGFIALFASSAAIALLRASTPSSAVGGEQPIAFNHRKHVEELQLECSTCHAFPENDLSSGLPRAEDCAMCHSEALGDSAAEAALLALIESGRPIAWKPLFRQPRHVFYSHRSHVEQAEIDCSICHGTIGASESPPLRATPLLMDECLECHERERASVACTACHR